MKKTTKYILIFILVVIAGVCLIALDMQRDEELLPEVKRLFELAETSTGSDNEAYLYLMGMDAAPDEDPVEVGRFRLKENEMLAENPEYEVREYSQKEGLSNLDGDIFCGFRDEECLRNLFTKEIDVDAIYKKHIVYIERGKKFFSYDHFKTALLTNVMQRFPAYTVVVNYHKLIFLKAVALHQRGDSQGAIDLLVAEVVAIRKKLSDDDFLIGKMVYTATINQYLNLASLIIGKSDIHIKLSGLSAEELDFEVLMSLELVFSYGIAKSTEKSLREEMGGGRTGKFLAKSLYKPNMTLNAMLPLITRAIKLSQLSSQEFIAEINKPIEYDDSFMIKNYVGMTILGMAGQSFEKYIARIKSLNISISLFNHLYIDKKTAEEFVNPYYPEKTAFKKDGRVCFDGPFEDELGLKCLLVSDNH